MSSESIEERAATIAALIREKAGYEARGDKDGIAAVDAELERIGANAAPSAKRAATRKKREA